MNYKKLKLVGEEEEEIVEKSRLCEIELLQGVDSFEANSKKGKYTALSIASVVGDLAGHAFSLNTRLDWVLVEDGNYLYLVPQERD